MLESSLFLMASVSEGLPMVLLEAMSYGIPCIAYHTDSGTDDIIKDEVYKVENNQRRKVNITDLGSNHINLRQVYLTALARSRYNLYITNGYI